MSFNSDRGSLPTSLGASGLHDDVWVSLLWSKSSEVWSDRPLSSDFLELPQASAANGKSLPFEPTAFIWVLPATVLKLSITAMN